MLQVQATQPSCGLTAPSAFKGKLRARRALKVHERWACDAPCPWTMERHLEWHVHRDNFHALWPWSGIIGITLKPETLKILALGLHISRCLEQDITSPLGKKQDISQEAHKEEIKARIASYGADRQSTQNKLNLWIDPLDPTSHPPTIENIVSGQLSDDNVKLKFKTQ